jgi:riboflavin synthase alpha subunit
MFTGIIEERGVVLAAGSRLEILCSKVAEDSGPGASVSVNGVCLTVVDRRHDGDGAVRSTSRRKRWPDRRWAPSAREIA